MAPVSHEKPYAGILHARFDEGASASEYPRRNALLLKIIMMLFFVLPYIYASAATLFNAPTKYSWTGKSIGQNKYIFGHKYIQLASLGALIGRIGFQGKEKIRLHCL